MAQHTKVNTNIMPETMFNELVSINNPYNNSVNNTSLYHIKKGLMRMRHYNKSLSC